MDDMRALHENWTNLGTLEGNCICGMAIGNHACERIAPNRVLQTRA